MANQDDDYTAKAFLSDEAYRKLKFASSIVLPGGATLYFTLCTIWGFPYGQQILGTAVAIQAFLGILMGISTNHYKEYVEHPPSHK